MPHREQRRVAHAIYEYGLRPFTIAVVFVLVALLWTFPLQHWMDYPFVFLFVGANHRERLVGGTNRGIRGGGALVIPGELLFHTAAVFDQGGNGIGELPGGIHSLRNYGKHRQFIPEAGGVPGP